MELPFYREHFDVILCGDVLEHLVDPWKTVKRMSLYLKPKGYFIASLPNIREIKTLANIVLRGKFMYSNSGILDNTHLRFFCKKDMIDLFEQNGLVVVNIRSNLDLLGKGKRAFLNRLTFRLFAEFLEGEYLLGHQETLMSVMVNNICGTEKSCAHTTGQKAIRYGALQLFLCTLLVIACFAPIESISVMMFAASMLLLADPYARQKSMSFPVPDTSSSSWQSASRGHPATCGTTL